MEKQRIGVLIDRLWLGGVEKIAAEEVRNLNKIDVEAKLVILKREKEKEKDFQEFLRGIPVVYLDDRLPTILKFSFKFPFFSFFSLFHLTYPLLIPWVIKENEFDIFYAHGSYVTFSAIGIKIFKKISFVSVVWDPIAYIIEKAYPSGPIKWFSRILIPLARFFDYLVITQSSKVMLGGLAHKRFLDSIKSASEKFFINPPSVYPATTLPEKRGDFLLTVTAWKEGKKPEYNLELAKQLREVKIVMAGSWYPDDLERKFKEKITEQNLSDQVIVTGKLSEKELNKLYLKARLFFQTQDDRGFGLSALEAAAQGCPFIIPKGQGVGELFKDKEDGFFVGERDTDSFLKLINQLLKDEKLAYRLGKNAYRKVVKEYSWEKHVQKMKEVSERLVS